MFRDVKYENKKLECLTPLTEHDILQSDLDCVVYDDTAPWHCPVMSHFPGIALWLEDILAHLVLPSVNSRLFWHTGASHEQGNRIWHHCLSQSQVQYRSQFYLGGYLQEVSKDAFNFSTKFCEKQSQAELSWRINGTPDLAQMQFCARNPKWQWGKLFFTCGVKTQRLQCGFEPNSDVNIRPTATFLYLLLLGIINFICWRVW